MDEFSYPSTNIDSGQRINSSGTSIFLCNDLGVYFDDYTIQKTDDSLQISFPRPLRFVEIDLINRLVEMHSLYPSRIIEHIDLNWQNFYIDYKKARATIAGLVQASGWDNLSLAEKGIASSWFVVPMELRITVHTISEQIKNGKYFHDQSVISREKRAVAGVSSMYNYLTKSDAFSVVDDVVGNDSLIQKYIDYGREGMNEDGMPGLFDYLASRDNSIFSGAGLIYKNITPNGVTTAQLSAAAMNIFKNGNYS